jgi:murein DD-endopeptidase MepM/ murein hydrolase activator NlpD
VTLALGAFGQSSKKVTDAKKKLGTVEKKIDSVRKELKGTLTEKHNMTLEIAKVDDNLDKIEGAVEDTQDQLAKNLAEQKRVAADLQASTAEMDKVRERVRNRIRSMYKQGPDSVYLVLAGSRDVSAFASRKAMLERIAAQDRALFDEAKALRKRIADRKAQKDKVVAQVAALEKKQTDEQMRLKVAMQGKVNLLNNLKKDVHQLLAQLDDLDRQSSRLENDIAAFQNGSGAYVTPHKGKLLMPVHGRLSSPFGYRIHPIAKTRRLHAGQDIAAPTGTTIKAAASGIVISAGRRGGYGNCVVIDHGGGMSTLYGHCSRLFVKAGQRISQGQKIAAVGSTGYSTGPHCHFEVRIKGKPVNPRGYL